MRKAHARGFLALLASLIATGAQAQGYVFLQKCADGFLGLELAGEYCTRAIKSGELSAESLAVAHYNRGAALSRRRAFDPAIADFDESIRLNAKPAAYVARGALKVVKRNTDGAIADFGEALRLDPSLAEAYLYRGQGWVRKGEPQRAIDDFTQALKLEPVGPIIQGGSIMMYTSRPRPRDRAAHDAGAHFGRGLAQSMKLEHEGAIADFNRALQLAPSADALKLRGLARFYRAEFTLAAADLAGTLRVNPRDTESALWLFLARSRAADATDPREELAAHAQLLPEGGWPRLIAALFLDKATPQQVFSAVPEKGGTRQALRCQASFFVGQWRLVKNQRPQAETLLRRAQERCPSYFPEYVGAAAELARLAN